MNKAHMLLCGLCFSLTVFAGSGGEAYLKKFQTYQFWSENLPSNPTPEFVSFIKEDTPLVNKLRNKWLYHLAKEKNWGIFFQYYQPSDNIELQCFYQTARHHLGYKKEALEEIKLLWLTGSSQPSACNELFKVLLIEDKNSEQLITQRIVLALEKRNLSLARYLLKQYKEPRLNDINLLNQIYRSPSSISTLQTAELHDDFYLYGLKRMVSTNMEQAIKYWHHVKTKQLLTLKQQQSFLAHIALYKAMRNHPDAPAWFAKIQPEFYNDALLDWQIRFALKQPDWREVERLIPLSKNYDAPIWLYWNARALEAQGKKKEAEPIYEQLAKLRNYYGFLASLRINKPLSFEQEPVVTDQALLEAYKPFTEQVNQLYNSNQKLQASRLLNDFVLELPKDERSALAYWLAHELKWHGKALYLSNTEELNNQILLRFPLAYRETVKRNADNYNLKPEFIFAIIRQESTFREDVVSHAGAHGLMQVMPATAKSMAIKEKIAYQNPQQLFSAPVNINLGSAYLQHLGKRFNHHPVLVAAAYNAGPRQVQYWLKNHPPEQIDIWVETLPWHETRNYLQNVIAFYAVYQHLMNKKPDLKEFLKPLN